MKHITELIEFALEHNLLTEENKRKLQENGFYTFYEDNDDDYQRDSEDLHEDELDRTYYDDVYAAGKGSGKRHNGKRNSSPVGPKLTVEELNQRVEEEWKKLTEEFPRLAPLWDSWKAGKLKRVFADGFTLNDIYVLMKVELPDYHDFSGPAPTAYRQLLRQVGNTMGKYSWVIKSPETASMVEFYIFRQQIFEEVRTLYETDCEKFAALSSQNGKLNFPFWEKAVQTDTTSMKVWTILNLSSKPVTPERIEEIQTWKPELAIAMQLNLDYITKLVQRDWSSLMVITECEIENTILKSVSIPEGVTALGIVIPEGVSAIGSEAFRFCRSLTSVIIPEGVKEIGSEAFEGCSSLTTVVIPEGVKEIGSEAFEGCSSLTTVVIPEGVKEIGYEAFKGCSSLTSVAIPEGVKEIGWGTFEGCTAPGKALLSEDGTILLNVNVNISGKFVIPESVKVIAPYAFDWCSSLTSVVIPEGVKEIGFSAFRGCSSLTSIVIPEGVTAIENGTFERCSSLTSVVIPDGVKKIKDGAFYGCAAPGKALLSEDGRILLSVNVDISGRFVIPESVKVIAPNAFCGCSSLTSVSIPEGVTEIGVLAFSGCSSLTSVAIPVGVTEIGYLTFSCCSSLTSVTIPEGVTTIGSDAFEDCSSLTSVALPKSLAALGRAAFRDCSSLKSVIIPEGVKEIGDNAFQGCNSLKSVVIPEGVARIGSMTFCGCSSLMSVTIPEGVEKIGYWAFYGCSSLKSIVLPKGVMTIGSETFRNCSSLTSVIIPEGVTTIESEVFEDCPNLTIHAPAGSYAEKYAKANKIPFQPLEEEK